MRCRLDLVDLRVHLLHSSHCHCLSAVYVDIVKVHVVLLLRNSSEGVGLGAVSLGNVILRHSDPVT